MNYIGVLILGTMLIGAIIGIWMQFDVWPFREFDHFGSSSMGE